MTEKVQKENKAKDKKKEEDLVKIHSLQFI